jgi:hypothetical protein
MDHGATADQQDDVFGSTHAEREQLAQLFAANLLMPPPLVMSILERAGSRDSTAPTSMHCYTLAREAGVSYEAAVRQLVNLEYLTAAQASELLRVRPLTIKTQLGFGRRPVNGWADVWPVDEQWDDQILDLRVEDEAVISLPENRSTGYRWMLADDPEPTHAPTDPPEDFGVPVPTDDLDDRRTDFLRRIGGVDPHSGAPGPVLRQLRARAPMDAVPAITSPLGDYHAVVAVGAATSTDGTTRRLLVRNSWGPGWGVGGFGWMPLEYLTAFAVEAAVLDPRAMLTY